MSRNLGPTVQGRKLSFQFTCPFIRALQLTFQSDNLDHLFPCPNGKVTHLGDQTGQVSCPVIEDQQKLRGLII